jgi:hypothetical protein
LEESALTRTQVCIERGKFLVFNDSARGQSFDPLSQVYGARSATVYGGKPDMSMLKLADIEGATG